jgi:hypothetical protein
MGLFLAFCVPRLKACGTRHPAKCATTVLKWVRWYPTMRSSIDCRKGS